MSSSVTTIRVKVFKKGWNDGWHLKVTRNGVPYEVKDLGHIEEDAVVRGIVKRCTRLGGAFITKNDVYDSFYQDQRGCAEYSAGFILEGR